MQFLCSVLLSSSLQFSWKVCTKHTMLKLARSKSKGLEQGAPRIYLCKGMWVLTCSYYSYCLFSLSWELWHHTELLGWGPLLRAPDALWRCVSGEVLSLFSCLLTKWRVDDQPSKPEWNLSVTDEVCFKLPISSNLYLIYLVFWHVFAAVVTQTVPLCKKVGGQYCGPAWSTRSAAGLGGSLDSMSSLHPGWLQMLGRIRKNDRSGVSGCACEWSCVQQQLWSISTLGFLFII